MDSNDGQVVNFRFHNMNKWSASNSNLCYVHQNISDNEKNACSCCWFKFVYFLPVVTLFTHIVYNWKPRNWDETSIQSSLLLLFHTHSPSIVSFIFFFSIFQFWFWRMWCFKPGSQNERETTWKRYRNKLNKANITVFIHHWKKTKLVCVIIRVWFFSLSLWAVCEYTVSSFLLLFHALEVIALLLCRFL